MDEKLRLTIDKIIRLCQQNAEFDKELRKRLGIASSANAVCTGDDRISDIYEYCIERVVRQQAQEFYKDFPVQSIVCGLVDDFCRMESFRRKNAFDDFCLSLYQQLECIVNTLCVNKDLIDIAERMWGYPAYVKAEKGTKLSIENRIGEYSIASLVFPGLNRNTGLSNAVEKSRTQLQSLYAIDKIRTIVYFVGYQAMMKSSDYDGFVEFMRLMSDIYQCRNTNHRGNKLNSWEEEILNRVHSQQSVYYLRFLGALARFVGLIKRGWDSLPDIKARVMGLPCKEEKLADIKVLGKIPLPGDVRKKSKKSK